MPDVDFHEILTFAAQRGVSDIHFQVGVPPMVRHNGELIAIKHPPFTRMDILTIAQHLTHKGSPEEVEEQVKEYDGTFVIPGTARYRVNVFRQRGNYAAVLRVIPLTVKSFEELNLPHILERITNLRRGLVLITGATGNGKSTTMASMIQFINSTRRAHIITIEDPIEFVFENDKAIISQREVGSDTDSFMTALKAALRQDPDAIMVGELRDHATVDTCMKAAETGHLVMASIHTPDVVKTMGRLLSYYPADEQAAVRRRIAENLMAVVSLRLLLNTAKDGLVPAVEVMMVTKTIEECILHPEKSGQIPEYMAKNRDFGMQTFNQNLMELVKGGAITLDVAKIASSHPDQLERDLMIE